MIMRQNHGGPTSPIAPHENYFVDIIIKLSYCCHSISSSEGLQLMNSLIKGTDIEKNVKEHKLKHTHVSDIESCSGMLGMGYWNRFKIRHKDRIVSKKG